MRVLYVTSEWLRPYRNGGSIRRNGLVGALRASGCTVDLVSVAHLARDRDFSTRFAGVEWIRHLPPLASYQVIHVEGLPLHWLVAEVARAGSRVLWDLCDSWILKYMSQLSQTFSMRDFLSCSASYASLVNGCRGGVVRTYIAERDRLTDARFPFVQGPTFVIPNGVETSLIVPERIAKGPVILGDWAYPPNQRGMDWLDSHIRSSGRPAPSPVRVFGLASERLPQYPWMHRVGYVDSLPEVYGTASFVLAPVVTGAGVKNKVLEAASLGIPVLTTEEGVAGLRTVPRWVSAEKTGSDFLRTWRAWNTATPSVPEEELQVYRQEMSWGACAERLMTLYSLGGS